MHAPLRIFSTKSFQAENVRTFMKEFESDTVHLLITDGIMSDFRHQFARDELDTIMVQRILTSFQLQKILMDSDDKPYYMALSSGVVSSWPGSIVASIYDIIRIMTYYHGCPVYMNIIGDPGIMSRYLGNRPVHMGMI
ncbi:MAG: hypothetical protein QXN26_05660 [Thermoplasmataceae archaeon]